MDGLHAFGKIFDFSSGPCFVREGGREGGAHKVPGPSMVLRVYEEGRTSGDAGNQS